ncbi:MAG: tetratricopeptide repeat protein [Candidatus Eisenbacteria sp.]|nr:tetratricopeptide repeat protein [Candidatus Eisenbacteria bacterium]
MAPPQSVVESIREAGAAYEASRYGEAVECYRQALALGWCSAALYYNLGCASYKAGRIGWAVAYFEEARRLSPRDPNIRHNLRTVTSKGRDRLPEKESSRLLGLLSGLLDSYSPSDVVRIIVALFWLGALVLAVHWTGREALRRWSRWGLALVALLVGLSTIGLMLKAYQIASAPSGVIVVEEAQVRSGPREGETVQFVLHAGTLLHMGRPAGEWREVWISDQMRGWVTEEAVVALIKPRWLP